MAPKPRKITRLYAKVPNVREISIEGAYGKVDKHIIVRFPDYLINARNLRSVDVDFRFFDLSPTQRNVYVRPLPQLISEIQQAAQRHNEKFGVVGNQHETEETRRKNRSRIVSAVWHWEVEKDGKRKRNGETENRKMKNGETEDSNPEEPKKKKRKILRLIRRQKNGQNVGDSDDDDDDDDI